MIDIFSWSENAFNENVVNRTWRAINWESLEIMSKEHKEMESVRDPNVNPPDRRQVWDKKKHEL